MTGKVFIDTTALVAYFDGRDIYHRDVREKMEEIVTSGMQLVLTDYIFDEAITTVKSKMGHHISAMAGEFMLQSEVIVLEWLDQEIKLRAWEYFRKHDDKGYSFTDCTSFVFMKEKRLTRCLAFDKHFEQAGFRLLS